MLPHCARQGFDTLRLCFSQYQYSDIEQVYVLSKLLAVNHTVDQFHGGFSNEMYCRMFTTKDITDLPTVGWLTTSAYIDIILAPVNTRVIYSSHCKTSCDLFSTTPVFGQVEPQRIELWTFCLQSRRSIQLS